MNKWIEDLLSIALIMLVVILLFMLATGPARWIYFGHLISLMTVYIWAVIAWALIKIGAKLKA